MNTFYFNSDASPMLTEAGFYPETIDNNTVRVITHETRQWFYHICYYLDLLSYEVE